MKKKAKKKAKKRTKKVPSIKIKRHNDIYRDSFIDWMNDNVPMNATDVNNLIDAIATGLVYAITRYHTRYEKEDVENFLAKLHAGIEEGFKQMRKRK